MNNDNIYTGFVKVYRSLMNHPLSNNSNYISLWLWLLLKATHKEMTINWCGKTIILQPGQLVTSLIKLNKDTGISVMRIRALLSRLKYDRQINTLTSNKSQIITIINWNDYQCNNTQDNSQITNKQQTTNKQLTPNKNVKNDNNVNNIFDDTPDVKKRVYSEFVQFITDKWKDIKEPEAFEQRALSAYPGIDIISEAKKAYAWEQSDPKRRKTKHQSFLINWFGRAQDRASQTLTSVLPLVNKFAINNTQINPNKGEIPMSEKTTYELLKENAVNLAGLSQRESFEAMVAQQRQKCKIKPEEATEVYRLLSWRCEQLEAQRDAILNRNRKERQ